MLCMYMVERKGRSEDEEKGKLHKRYTFEIVELESFMIRHRKHR
jgi:hypothetical protein